MPKARVLKTLDEKSFKWVENQETLTMPGRPQKTGSERQRFYHIRQVALKEISDLTRLAEMLPEDQLNQVFTNEKLLGLFRALFKLGPFGDNELLKKKRNRLLPLCFEIITRLKAESFAAVIAPTFWNALRHEGGPFPGLRAVYYRSLIEDGKLEKFKVTE